MKETVSLILLFDDILLEIDGRSNRVPLNVYQKDWMIESVLQWCAEEGTLRDVKSDPTKVDNGLPLILPGKRYHISLSKYSYQILQSAVRLFIDDLFANPQNWTILASKIGYDLFFGFLNNIKKIEPDEIIVLDAISSIKKTKYRGMKKGPSIHEIIEKLIPVADTQEPTEQSISAEKIQEICKGLEKKGIIKEYNNRYSIVF